LDTFGQKLDHLSQQMSGLEQQVEAGQQAILTRIDKRHQGTVSKLLQQMKADQLQLVNQLEEAIEQGEIARREGRELSHQLEIMLEELIEKFSDHPDAQQWESLLSLLEQQTSWQQKLKLTIPIVPGILEFESEAAVDVKDALKGAWNRLISKFKS
jgi:predicted outer membrane protein